MKEGIVFIAGVYGVGKSTLCKSLEKYLNFPAYSAGDLISEINGEHYGSNKVVKDKDANQNILIAATKNKLKETPKIMLAGHFCIFNAINEVEILPEHVYTELPLLKIILLEAEINRICDNIKKRDNKKYSQNSLIELIKKEREQAIKISTNLNIPMIVHTMCYDRTDTDKLINLLKGSGI